MSRQRGPVYQTGGPRAAWTFAVVLVVAIAALAAVVAVAQPFSRIQPLEVALEELPQSTASQQSAPSHETAQSAPIVEEELPPEPQQFVIAAGGDVLIHAPVATAAWDGSRHQFASKMTEVTPYLEAADVSICNMETPIREPGLPPLGYPVFGAPYELVEELSLAGFDGCTTATNHAMDQGWDGLVRTLDAFDAAGMGHEGTARSEREFDQAQLYTVEKGEVSLTIANIAATYGTNGIPVPADAPWAVTFIDTDLMIAQARAAREAGADLVVASVHCCHVEYDVGLEPIQVQIAEDLASSGEVDILVNHQAHVPKHMALLPGGPGGEGMWTAYGLGNFISNQGARNGQPETTETGVLAFFYIDYDGLNPPRVTSGTWAAVTVDYNNGFNLLVANEDGMVAAQSSERPTMTIEEMQHRRQVVADVMGVGDGAEQTGIPENEPGVTTVVSLAEQGS